MTTASTTTTLISITTQKLWSTITTTRTTTTPTTIIMRCESDSDVVRVALCFFFFTDTAYFPRVSRFFPALRVAFARRRVGSSRIDQAGLAYLLLVVVALRFLLRAQDLTLLLDVVVARRVLSFSICEQQHSDVMVDLDKVVDADDGKTHAPHQQQQRSNLSTGDLQQQQQQQLTSTTTTTMTTNDIDDRKPSPSSLARMTPMPLSSTNLLSTTTDNNNNNVNASSTIVDSRIGLPQVRVETSIVSAATSTAVTSNDAYDGYTIEDDAAAANRQQQQLQQVGVDVKLPRIRPRDSGDANDNSGRSLSRVGFRFYFKCSLLFFV